MEYISGGRKRTAAAVMILLLVIICATPLSGCSGKTEGSQSQAQSESAGSEGFDEGTEADAGADDNDEPYRIAVAWSNVQDSYSYTSTIKTVEALGAEPVILDMVRSYDLSYKKNGEFRKVKKTLKARYDSSGRLKAAEDKHGILTEDAAKLVKVNSWQNSNVEDVMKDVRCIIIPGGWDISPTLYYKEQGWHGIKEDTEYSAERDVSDYLLMSYCLDNDIPMIAICRGMQMLSVVSGADIIQDLGKWYDKQGIEYHSMHRDPEKKDLVPHDAKITSHDSLLYEIVGEDRLKGVPSWHHQAVRSVKDTRLIVTAKTKTDGKNVIEAVERPDKRFCIGVQFHPEVAMRKVVDKEENADEFMSYETAEKLFMALIREGYPDGVTEE